MHHLLVLLKYDEENYLGLLLLQKQHPPAHIDPLGRVSCANVRLDPRLNPLCIPAHPFSYPCQVKHHHAVWPISLFCSIV